MAEDPAPPAEAAPAPAAAKPSKIVPILVLLNLAATGAGVFLQLRHTPEAAAAVPAAPEAVTAGPMAPLDSFVVNLNEQGTSRYLKATFELELANAHAVEDLEKGKRMVRDEVLRYLSGLTVADTLGAENKEKIQREIVARSDKSLGGGRVKRVFFTDFVVQ